MDLDRAMEQAVLRFFDEHRRLPDEAESRSFGPGWSPIAQLTTLRRCSLSTAAGRITPSSLCDRAAAGKEEARPPKRGYQSNPTISPTVKPRPGGGRVAHGYSLQRSCASIQ
jgi:hypothetical protein